MRTSLRLVDVDEGVAGSTVVPWSSMTRGLSPTALHLWTVLVHLRDRMGHVRVTDRGLCKVKGFQAVRLESAKSALKQLRSAGLLKPIGKRIAAVKRGSRDVECEVFIRQVRGARLLGPLEEALVPAETAAWLDGKRGRGRPRIVHPGGRVEKNVVAKDLGAFEAPHPPSNNSHPRVLQVHPSAGQKSSPPGIYTLSNYLTGRSTPSSPKGEDPGPKAGLSLREDERGTTLSFDGPHLPPAHLRLAGLPAAPSPDLVAAAHVPPPPQLDELADPLVWAQALVDAYRGACRSRYRTARAFPRATLSRQKWYPGLIKAAEALIDYEIAPASWAAWSCDVWRKYGAKGRATKKPPQLTWIWSAARIEERHGWFRSEAGGYGGGRLIVGPALRDLLTTYQRARVALLNGGSTEEVLAQYMPGDTWLKKIDAARREAADYTERMRRQARAGEWLW